MTIGLLYLHLSRLSNCAVEAKPIDSVIEGMIRNHTLTPTCPVSLQYSASVLHHSCLPAGIGNGLGLR